MKYRILKIVKVSDNFYDVDYEEVRRFRRAVTYKCVRTEFSSSLGVIVSTVEYLHNFKQILEAYNYSDVDFTERSEPLPKVSCITGRAIY